MSRERALKCALAYAQTHRLRRPSAIFETEGGKPDTDGATRLSVSHSGQLWACAVHDQPVGLDVQIVGPRPFEAIVRRFFCAEEAEFLSENPEDFFKLWCAKEALVKLYGEGLGGFSRRAAATREGLLEHADGVSFHHFCPEGGYAGCLCAQKGAEIRIILSESGC